MLPALGTALVLVWVVLSLAGCGADALRLRQAAPDPDAPAAVATMAAETEADVPSPLERPPRWESTVGLVQPEPVTRRIGPPPPRFDLSEPQHFRQQVQTRCAERPDGMDEDLFISSLVAELYADGVEPGLSADALIRGGCAKLVTIVRELVAQGGPAAVVPVSDRALFLVGPSAEGLIEAAVSAGLRGDVRALAPGEGAGLRAAMRYFPMSAGSETLQETSDPQALAGAAEPGYALYTYILIGAADEAADNRTYRELLRVIETYVLAAAGMITAEAELPRAQRHAFLVPVRPERSGAELLAQTDPALAAPMRTALVRHLQAQGEQALADRLEQAPGPFLITAADPALIPAERNAPRLLVDLSAIGPEYMYAVVDVYDRPVAVDLAGTPQGLLPVQQRLLGLFPQLADPDAVPTAAETLAEAPAAAPQSGATAVGALAQVAADPDASDWVFLVGPVPVAAEPTADPADQAEPAAAAAAMLADAP